MHIRSPLTEAKNSSASQEILRILWNPKVKQSVNMTLSVHVLSQINPLYAPIPLVECLFYYYLSIYA